MEYTKQYATEAAYLADSGKTKPNVSFIIEDKTSRYNPFNINGRVAEPGTIVMVKTATPTEKIFVPYESYDKATYSAYTPIGVVVMPFSHTPDDTVRVMSLKNMDCTHPDNGSTATGGNIGTISMYWGGYGTDTGLPNLDIVPNIDPNDQKNGTIGSTAWARIPSNYVKGSTFDGGVDSVLDIGTKYYEGTESGRYGISPYVIYDWKSTKCLDVIDKSRNAMRDYDGSGNTATILTLDDAHSSAWRTASTIENNSGSTNVHAPAQCCWRYSTLGTTQGQWYLPACGELAYLPARYADINEALTRLMAADSTQAVRLWRDDPSVHDSGNSVYGRWLWSSTEYSSINARNVGVNNGDVTSLNKNYSTTNNRVRAFAALSI